MTEQIPNIPSPPSSDPPAKRRWMRRHPKATAVGGVLVLVGVIGTATGGNGGTSADSSAAAAAATISAPTSAAPSSDAPTSAAPTDTVVASPSADPTDAAGDETDAMQAQMCQHAHDALAPWFAAPGNDTLQTAIDQLQPLFAGDRSSVGRFGKRMVLDLEVVLAENQTLGTIPKADAAKAEVDAQSLQTVCLMSGYQGPPVD